MRSVFVPTSGTRHGPRPAQGSGTEPPSHDVEMLIENEEISLAMGKIVQQTEDKAERLLKLVKPYARGLAKFCILFFHILVSLLLLIEYYNATLFLGWSLGVLPEESEEGAGNETTGENADGTKPRSTPPETANFLSHMITLGILVSRILPVVMIYARKHIIPACIVLALLPCSVMILQLYWHVTADTTRGTYVVLFTCLSLAGSLCIITAETLEEKDVYLAGIPRLGINKRLSVVQLVARLTIVCVFLGVQQWYVHRKSYNDMVFYAQLLVIAPMVLSVMVGYKTQLMSVVLAGWLLAVSLISFPFYIHLANGKTAKFWTEACLFSGNLAAIGGLIFVAILGAGTYSVDHLKKT